MKTYPQADVPKNDTTQYILANLKYCLLHTQGKYLLVSYLRGQVEIDDTVDYFQLDQAKRGLANALSNLHKTVKEANHFSRIAKATCAYALDAFIDLRNAGLNDNPFPFLSNIRSVQSTDKPGLFKIKCLQFLVNAEDPNTCPVADVVDEDDLLMPTEVMEKLWPDSTRYIPIMESLGYPDHEMVSTLFTGLSQPNIIASLDDVRFDV